MIRQAITALQSQIAETTHRWRDDDGSLLAASMAYYAVLSFFPLLLVLIAVFGFVLQFSTSAQNAQQELLRILSQNTSSELAAHVRTALAEIQTNALVGGPLGLFTLLLASIGIFRQVERIFGRIWDVGPKHRVGILAAIVNTLFRRLRAFLMLLVVGSLLVAVFVVSIAVSAAHGLASDLPGGAVAWSLGHVLLGVAVNWLLFTAVYKFIPRAPVRWADASRGGLLAAILWEATRQLLAWLLIGRRYTAYGVVGSLLALMLWVYVASNVIILGAEYARVVGQRRRASS